MRTFHIFAALLTLVVLAGCNSNNKGKIEGTKWSSKPTTVKGKTLPAGALKLEFTKDGKVTYTIQQLMGTIVYSGTYNLGFGDYVTLNFDEELGGHKKHRQEIVIDGNNLTMSDTDGTSIKFSKVN